MQRLKGTLLRTVEAVERKRRVARRGFEGHFPAPELRPSVQPFQFRAVSGGVGEGAVEHGSEFRQLGLDGHRAAAGVLRRLEEQGLRRRRRRRRQRRVTAAADRRHGRVAELVDDVLLRRRKVAVHGARQLCTRARPVTSTCQT